MRGQQFEYCVFSQFEYAINFMGRCYLNSFLECSWIGNVVGFRNTFQVEAGGQTKFYNPQFIANETAIDTSDGSGFDISIFGGSISEGKVGIKQKNKSPMFVYGTTFESNKDSGNGRDIWITNTDSANGNTDATHILSGTKHLETSDASLFIDDNAAGFSDIQLSFSIEGCEFASLMRFDSAIESGLVLGETCTVRQGVSVIGLREELDGRLTGRWRRDTFKSSVFSVSDSGGTNKTHLLKNVGAGQKLVMRSIDQSAIKDDGSPNTENISVTIQRWDGAAWQTELSIFGKGVTDLFEWENTDPQTRQIRVRANDAGSGLQYSLSFYYKIG
ncbi:hypothetical protein NVP1084O_175 [Vibrio phage 1.084.O._10N.261.49.F5]|nr:hypothetical protein NVP1084O_175 [Vibrio phage 1.084.O._10N.261.49.F5]